MSSFRNHRTTIYFVILLSIISSPIWGVRYFINHDGSSHAFVAYVMREILTGNRHITNTFELNSLAVPNSSGHWLIAVLLSIFSPIVVTKLMMTITLAAFAASALWLRFSNGAKTDPGLAALLTFAIGTNWLWSQGSYNYILAAAASTFTLGLFYRWRSEMTLLRTICLSLLLVFTFISHLVSFAVLAGALVLLAVFAEKHGRSRSILSVGAALLPTLPLIVLYKRLSAGSDPFVPAWRALSDPASLSSWAKQLVWADPFVSISRKTLPFSSEQSSWFIAAAPSLWIAVGIAILAAGSIAYFRTHRSELRRSTPFILLAAGCALAGVFGPDDFGLRNGGILRERFLIFALIGFTAIFRSNGRTWVTRAAAICLVFVIGFQTAALWDYSIRTTRVASQFIEASNQIPAGSSIASVIIMDDCLRFHSLPETQIDNYLGIGRNMIVWDNYEFGHYMFPVTTVNIADRKFAFDLTTSTKFCRDNPDEDFNATFMKQNAVFSAWPDKVDHVIVWGDDQRLWPILNQWFSPEPDYATEHLRVLHRRSQ